MSCGSGTMRYAWADSACNSRNWYPQGESGPDGCTRRCARAAAIKRASIQLLAVGPSREGKVSRCSKDFSRLKNSSICQRSRYNPSTASAGNSAVVRVVRIQMTSALRVRAAMARTGIQAMALEESQVLWLLVRSGLSGHLDPAIHGHPESGQRKWGLPFAR